MLDPLFRDAATHAVFDDAATVQRMLDVEAALSRAEADCGIIPASSADVIARCAQAGGFDPAKLAGEARSAGNLAIPLVKALTARVAEEDPQAAGFVHWGATSQDIVDTATVLQLKAALDLLDAGASALIATLLTLVKTQRDTVMSGRTWLQQAVPVTFGLKAAGWLDALVRDRARLREARPRLLVIQFGGASGTLASLDQRGLEVGKALADRLALGHPAISWHAHRDRIVEAGAIVGVLAGSLGKMARDISLLMQSEVAEAFEPSGAGRGGSSTMPHKRNPVGCSVALAAAIRVPGLVGTLFAAMPQEHERGLGNWPAEWETLPQIIELAAGSLAAMNEVVGGLELDPAQMRRNIDLSHGLVFAERVSMRLASALGRHAAHELTTLACRRAVDEGRDLKDVLSSDPAVTRVLPATELAALFDPAQALGVTQQIIDRVLAAAAQS